MTEPMGGLCQGKGVQNNTSIDRKLSIYPPKRLKVSKKSEKIIPCSSAPILLTHPSVSLALLTLHSTLYKWGFVRGLKRKRRENFIDDSFMCMCVCVCMSYPPSCKCTGGGLQIACLGDVYCSQTSCCREGWGVYCYYHTKGWFVPSWKGITPPHIPHGVKKWTLFLILRLVSQYKLSVNEITGKTAAANNVQSARSEVLTAVNMKSTV